MIKRVILFLLAYLVWILLNWVPDWQHLIAGLFAATIVAYITGDFFITRPQSLRQPHRYWYFIVHYIPKFLWECIKANIDVAYRVLHPGVPINPGIVKIRTNLKSDAGITFLANSITLNTLL